MGLSCSLISDDIHSDILSNIIVISATELIDGWVSQRYCYDQDSKYIIVIEGSKKVFKVSTNGNIIWVHFQITNQIIKMTKTFPCTFGILVV
jgi:hypothetical protein